MNKRAAIKTYSGFFGPIEEKISSISRTYGRERAYRSIRAVGGKKFFPDYYKFRRGRLVEIPVDTETFSTKVVVLEFNIYTTKYLIHPSLWLNTKDGDESQSLHPQDLTKKRGSEYQKTILEKLDQLETELAKI